MERRILALMIALGLLAGVQRPGHSIEVRPEVSILGQPFARITDDSSSADRKRVRLDPGETELAAEGHLTTSATGLVTLSLRDQGLRLEEGYFTLQRGLPGGLALKGGKYRVPFGLLNPAHDHTLPFARRFGVIRSYLPGDHGLVETGLSLSELLPIPGDVSVVLSADYLQGDSFRRPREADSTAVAAGDPLLDSSSGPDRSLESRPAVFGRLSAFLKIGERSGLAAGLSAVHGTNNVAAGTRTSVFGADVRATIWNSPRSYLLVQAEGLKLYRWDASWDPQERAYRSTRIEPYGGYVFADYLFSPRYDAGASYQAWQRDTVQRTWNQGIGVFAGMTLQENLAFRLDGTREFSAQPLAGSSQLAVYTATLRAIFGMGPHKIRPF